MPNKKTPTKGDNISPHHTDFSDCGYIIGEDEIIIDIDTIPHDVIKKMIHIFELNTETVWTERGAHLYFKLNGQIGKKNGICALGFPIESKTVNNKYVTVKRNNVLRKIDNYTKRMVLPDIFKIKRGKYEYYNFQLLDKGSRNNVFFENRYKYGHFEQPLFEKIYRFINQYIIEEPMDEKEISNLTREYQDFSKMSFETIAQQVINRFKIVNYLGIFYVEIDGELHSDKLAVGRAIQIFCIETEQDKSQTEIEKIMKYIHMKMPMKDYSNEPIAFDNGFLKDGKFYEGKYEKFTPYVIKQPYIEGKTSKMVDDYLDFITGGSTSLKLVVEEILGYFFVTDRNIMALIAQFFIIKGKGANGKGTFLHIIRHMLGHHLCSGIDVSQFLDERYLPSMIGKLANLADDAKDEPLNQDKMRTIKNMTTADSIQIRKLYHEAVMVSFICKLVITTNHTLKSFEKGDSFKRRLTIFQIQNQVVKSDLNFRRDIVNDENIQCFISKAVEGYKRLYKQKGFTQSQELEKYKKEYERENDNTIEFFEGITKESLIGRTCKDVREEYELYCENNLLKPVSTKMLGQAIKDYFNLTSKVSSEGGVKIRIYINDE